MIIENVREYLINEGFVKEGDIFLHNMPINVELGILLVYTNEGIRVNQEIRGYYQDSFGLIIRGKKFANVKERTETIVNILDNVNFDMSDVHFNFLKPATIPLYYPKDSSSNYESNVVMDFSCYVKKG